MLAVDWSGAAQGASQHIWAAEAIEPGRLVRLECGRDRLQLADHLSRLPTQDFVVGLDFAFSFPLWFVDQIGVRSAAELWAYVAASGDAWLERCEPPFWGRRGHPRPSTTTRHAFFRRTELAVPRTSGLLPKSVFQVGGAGSVGTGSVRGMPLLCALHTRGAAIWPFTCAGSPVVVEIYPRLMTGPVRKSNPNARSEFIARNYPLLDDAHRRLATGSEDAFDAAVSALVMIEHATDLSSLPVELDPVLRLEGRIWHPGWREDRL